MNKETDTVKSLRVPEAVPGEMRLGAISVLGVGLLLQSQTCVPSLLSSMNIHQSLAVVPAAGLEGSIPDSSF